MEGALAAQALVETWGDAAGTAQEQAERMTYYRDAGIAAVEIVDVRWSLGACMARDHEGWVQVMLATRWQYNARLTCAGGGIESSSWVETFPAESYALVGQGAGWRIASWLPGAPVAERRWRCP
jgi:hypothetical protein